MKTTKKRAPKNRARAAVFTTTYDSVRLRIEAARAAGERVPPLLLALAQSAWDNMRAQLGLPPAPCPAVSGENENRAGAPPVPRPLPEEGHNDRDSRHEQQQPRRSPPDPRGFLGRRNA